MLSSCLGQSASASAVAYEERRLQDAEALVRIVRVAAPFQRLGNWWRDGGFGLLLAHFEAVSGGFWLRNEGREP